jgi:hypothetical protein
MMIRKLIATAAASLLASTAGHAAWYQAQSKHFVVYADTSESDVKAFTEKLERFDKAIRVWHVAKEDVRGPSARVNVFVVSDVGAIQKLARSSNVAGFYRPVAGESVAFTPRTSDGDLSAQAILFHEYTHHWMLTNWTDAALPPWFVEGFAELHATALFRNNAVVFGAVPAYRRYTIGQMNLVPMSRLLRFDPGLRDPVETDALYSHGWALAHYLTFDPARRGQLAAYIGALNSGKAASAAQLVGSEGDKLDIKLNSYVRRPSLPSTVFSYDQLPIEKVTVRKLIGGEAATMPVLILSKGGIDQRSAPRVAALARRLAATFPNDAAAQNELAEAEMDVCDTDKQSDAACYSRVVAAADRAIAADPKSIHALVYKGSAQVAALKKDKVTDSARWTAARAPLLAANRVDTEAPQPLVAFYDSFRAAGQPAPKGARAAMLYAYALAPYDTRVRVKAASVYLSQGKLPEARIALAPAAYNVENGTGAQKMLKVLAAIDGGNADAASAELAKLMKEAEDPEKKGEGKKGD